MYPLNLIIMCFIYCGVSNTASAKPLRQKRYITPTKYPTPPTVTTTRQALNLQASSPPGRTSASFTSTPVNCPVKRDVSVNRVLLTPEMMKWIYLNEVGRMDDRYLAESRDKADSNFVDLVASGITSELANDTETTRKHVEKNMQKIRKWLGDTVWSRKQTASPEFQNSHVWMKGKRTFIRPPVLLKQNVTHEIIPAYLNVSLSLETLQNVYLPPRKVKRASDGSPSPTAYPCVARGSATDDGYLHMCSKCPLSTVLPADRYPRYINEVSCDSSDCDCFTVRNPMGQTTAHGKCKTTILYMKMLKKQARGCRLIISNGQQIITDDWVLYNQKIRTGCECVIDKRSVFAAYIPKS